MAKIRLDGVDHEASEQLSQVIGVMQTKHDTALRAASDETTKLKANGDKLQAKVDSLTEEKAKLEKEHKDALDPDKIQEAVRARVDLEQKAVEILGTEEKLDGLSDEDIRKKVILKQSPEAKLDEQSTEYVQARYDHIMETTKPENKSLGDVRQAASQAAGTNRMDAAEARQRMMDRDDKRWQGEQTDNNGGN